MDAFDFQDAKPAPSSVDRGELTWNILTLVILGITGIIGLIFLVIFINPYAGINPFPPPTALPTVALPAITPTPGFTLPPTWTPAPTEAPSATPTLKPSSTPVPTNTPFGAAAQTLEATPAFSFVLQQGSPQSIPNIIRMDAGCNWLGVAGQAVSLNGAPVVGLFIQLGGTLDGQLLETRLSMTGTAPEYGKGGFEFVLADKPIASNNTLWVQLLDQANLPLSEKIPFSTFAECEKNLILINFNQVK
jgi:hypothetical protein